MAKVSLISNELHCIKSDQKAGGDKRKEGASTHFGAD